MGRRAAELAGVLVASLVISFVTGLALAAPNDPVLYVVGALVPLAMLLIYWLWLEPRADTDRLRARRLHQAVNDAFDLTQPQADASAPRNAARRAFYDRLDISDLFEPDHIEDATMLGDALDAGRALLARMVDDADGSGITSAEIEAWESRTADAVEIARGPGDVLTLRQSEGAPSAASDASERRRRLEFQVLLLEIWLGEERKRAGERAKDRYR